MNAICSSFLNKQFLNRILLVCNLHDFKQEYIRWHVMYVFVVQMEE